MKNRWAKISPLQDEKMDEHGRDVGYGPEKGVGFKWKRKNPRLGWAQWLIPI